MVVEETVGSIPLLQFHFGLDCIHLQVESVLDHENGRTLTKGQVRVAPFLDQDKAKKLRTLRVEPLRN